MYYAWILPPPDEIHGSESIDMGITNESLPISYTQHVRKSLQYSWLSSKSAYYFLINALIPGIYKMSGINTISKLQHKL